MRYLPREPVDAGTSDPYIAVADRSNSRVQVLTTDGVFVGSVGGPNGTQHEGVPPPASRYPTLAQNTLVAAGDVYPVPIPGLGYRVQYARAEAIEPESRHTARRPASR